MAGKKKDAKNKGFKREPRAVPTSCAFCDSKIVPDYKELEAIVRFISDRGRILPRGRTGICARHQRLLSKAVKRARHLAILPFSHTV